MNHAPIRRHAASSTWNRSILEIALRLRVWPFFVLCLVGLLLATNVLENDWRLMAMAWSATAFNTGTVLILLKHWKSGVVVSGLILNYLVQSFFVGTICIPGAMDYLWFYQPYGILLGREVTVFFCMIVVSLAALTLVPIRAVFAGGRKAAPEGAAGSGLVANDPRLRWLLGFGAIFTLLFWMGSLVDFGVVKAVLQVLQRAFTLVPFIAGFYYRRLGWVTLLWIVVIFANVALGVATGSRGPAFLPAIFFLIGLIVGSRGRERLLICGLLAFLAIPGSYVFGMIEVIRTDVGRLSLSELNADKLSQVASSMTKSRGAMADEYESLPAWVRTNIRIVTWPTLVVACVANNSGAQRGFDDLPDQLLASLNVVAITGQATSYYNEGLFNLRASDYGFRVDEGTSVEFGLIAESWDRGGLLAAYIYSLVAVISFCGVESLIRRMLRHGPAFQAIAISVAFSTAFLTLNIYNLPLSLRHMAVNLLVCFALFGVLSAFSSMGQTAKPAAPNAPATPPPRRRT